MKTKKILMKKFNWEDGRGVWPVCLTPFTEQDEIDWSAFEELVEFYIQSGVRGLFINCLSSEVFQLSAEERLEAARQVVKMVNGRIGVVSGANFGETLDDQASSLARFQETGVDAAVALVSLLPSSEDLGAQLLALARQAPGKLGVYECPVPKHWLLNPGEVSSLAQSGRYVFFKETSRKMPVYAQKLAAAHGSPLWVYQANLQCLKESIDLGGPGFCGIIANVCPELTAMACSPDQYTVGDRCRITGAIYAALIAVGSYLINEYYPLTAKYILQQRGLKLSLASRIKPADSFPLEKRRELDKFLDGFDYQHPSLRQMQTRTE